MLKTLTPLFCNIACSFKMKFFTTIICKVIYVLLAVTAFFHTNHVQAETWQVKDCGTIAIWDQGTAIALNDKGNVLCKRGHMPGRSDEIWAVSTDNSVVILPQANKPQMFQGYLHNYYLDWLTVNLDGVIGIQNKQYQDGFVPEIIIWNFNEGLKKYNFNPSIKFRYSADIKIAKCSNSKYLAITCNDDIYILKDEKLINISPQLRNELESIGFNFYDIKWNAISINNNGVIFGVFQGYEKHPFKDKPVLVYEDCFIWNNGCIILMKFSFDKNAYRSYIQSHAQLNNNNEVFLYLNNISWIWSETDGYKDITLYHNPENKNEGILGHAKAVLDDHTIVYEIGGQYKDIMFQNENESFILKFFEENHSDNIDIGRTYKNLKSDGNISLINNKKELVFQCQFMNEWHPFLLSPKQ